MQTYYVSLAGSDTAAGTSQATAWRTIGAAIAHIAAGDTILVGPGTYHEQIDLNVKGATLTALDSETPPIIDGRYTLPVGELQEANILLPDDTRTAGFAWGALMDITANDAVISHLDCRNSRGRGLRITNKAKNAKFTHMKMTGSRSQGFIVDDATYSGIEKSEISRACNFATSWRPPSVALYPKGGILIRAKHCFISDCHFHHFYGGALGTLDSEDCQINGNTVHDSWRSGINLTKSTRCKVYANHLYQKDPEWLGRAFGGLILLPEVDYPGGTNVDCEMYNNLVVDYAGACHVAHESAVENINCTIRNNTFINRRAGEQVAVFRKANATLRVDGNIFVGSVEVAADFVASNPTFAKNCWSGVDIPAGLREAHDIDASPALADAAGDAADARNFWLTPGSPARGLGAFPDTGEPVEPPLDRELIRGLIVSLRAAEGTVRDLVEALWLAASPRR